MPAAESGSWLQSAAGCRMSLSVRRFLFSLQSCVVSAESASRCSCLDRGASQPGMDPPPPDVAAMTTAADWGSFCSRNQTPLLWPTCSFRWPRQASRMHGLSRNSTRWRSFSLPQSCWSLIACLLLLLLLKTPLLLGKCYGCTFYRRQDLLLTRPSCAVYLLVVLLLLPQTRSPTLRPKSFREEWRRRSVRRPMLQSTPYITTCCSAGGRGIIILSSSGFLYVVQLRGARSYHAIKTCTEL